jgi:hypothetical protein
MCVPSSYLSLFSNPNATYEQSSNSSRAAAATRLAYFLRRLSSNLVGIADATKPDVTSPEKISAEILHDGTVTRALDLGRLPRVYA